MEFNGIGAFLNCCKSVLDCSIVWSFPNKASLQKKSLILLQSHEGKESLQQSWSWCQRCSRARQLLCHQSFWNSLLFGFSKIHERKLLFVNRNFENQGIPAFSNVQHQVSPNLIEHSRYLESREIPTILQWNSSILSSHFKKGPTCSVAFECYVNHIYMDAFIIGMDLDIAIGLGWIRCNNYWFLTY